MDTKEKKTASGTGRKTARNTTRMDTASKSGSATRRRKQTAASAPVTEKKQAASAARKVRRPAPNKVVTPAPDVVYTPAKPFSRERFLMRMATVVAVVIALMFGISIFFRVEHVKVSGADKYTPYMIQEAAGIKEGDALLGLSDARISGKITSALPYVESVSIAIELPNTVHIEIKEMDVVYAIRDDKDGWWLITADGRVVINADNATAGACTVIEGVRLSDPVSGGRAEAAEVNSGIMVEDPVTGAMVPQFESGDSRLSTALTILQYLEDNVIIGEVASVNVGDLTNLELWYGQRFRVKLGDTTELGYKIRCMNAAINGKDGLDSHDSGILDISFTIYPDSIGYSVFQ